MYSGEKNVGLGAGVSIEQQQRDKQAYVEREKLNACAASPQTEIVQVLTQQGQSLNHLDDVIQTLRSKLYPVLVVYPEPKGDGTCSPRETMSPFGEALQNNNFRLKACIEELAKMIGQLSV